MELRHFDVTDDVTKTFVLLSLDGFHKTNDQTFRSLSHTFDSLSMFNV